MIEVTNTSDGVDEDFGGAINPPPASNGHAKSKGGRAVAEALRSDERAELARLRADEQRRKAEEEARQSGGRKPARYRRAPDLEAGILKLAGMPWIEIMLEAGGVAIVRGRIGAYVVLIGWEGSGKSSLVMQMGIVLARADAAFIYFTTELDAEEAATRAVGIQAHEGWENVQRGRVAPGTLRSSLAMPNFVILAEEDATLDNLEATILELRAEKPERPIVVAIDYLQDLDVEGRDERSKVRAASRTIRRLAKRLRVFTIGVSQTSRAGREDLRSGDAIGSDTVTKGAESAQIERDAYTTLALGNPSEQPDGTTTMDLSVGKGRMSKGDRVWPVVFDGRTGRFTLAGDARSGTEVRAERSTEREQSEIAMFELAIEALVSKADAPVTRTEIEDRIRGNAKRKRQAMDNLVERGAVVEIIPSDAKKKRGRPLWTRDKAEAAGLVIRPVMGVSS